MNSPRLPPLLPIAAACLLAAGAILAAWTAHRAVRFGPAMQVRTATLAKLYALEADQARSVAARRRFEALPDYRLPDLAALAQRVEGLPAPEGQTENRRDIAPGWVARQVTVPFGEVPLPRLMDFVAAAESLRPPWRLAKCDLRSSARSPGNAKAVLVFEGIERAAAGPTPDTRP